MRTIKFKTTEFPIASYSAVPDRFSVSIIKGDKSVDAIVNEVTGSSQFRVTEDGTTIGIYNGYSKLIAVTLLKNVPVNKEIQDIVSVEFANEDLQNQVNSLTSKVDTQVEEIKSTQQNQEANIGSLMSSIQSISNIQAILDEAIGDLANVVSDIYDSIESEG